MQMQPKIEWVINVVLFFLLMIGGGLLVFLSEFTLGAVVEGVVFYGSILYFILSAWLDRRKRNSSALRARKRRAARK